MADAVFPLRQAVNDWIRTSGDYEAVIDFDEITRDPSFPTRFLPLYDSGDHYHPNHAGYQAMGEVVRPGRLTHRGYEEPIAKRC